MKTITEYLQKGHISNTIKSKEIYPEKIQEFMDDINEFLDETIVPLNLYEIDKNGYQEKNKDGWFYNGEIFRRWFKNYTNGWDNLVNLIKNQIQAIAKKYNLKYNFNYEDTKILLYSNKVSQKNNDNFCFGIVMYYAGSGQFNIVCIVQPNHF